MQPQLVSAILADSSRRILLIRRRNCPLWRLPGSLIRGVVVPAVYLASCCRCQIGVQPEFNAPLAELNFAGRRTAVGRADIVAMRVRPSQRIDTAQWFDADALPESIDPISRYAIALLHDAHEPAFVEEVHAGFSSAYALAC